MNQQDDPEPNTIKPKRAPQYYAALAATIGSVVVGTTWSWSSPASQSLRDGTYLNGYKVSLEEESWVAGLMPLAAALITLPATYLSDKIGRKTTLLVIIVPFLIGWALLLWPNGVVMLYLGRFIHGLGSGTLSAIFPIYTAEIAEKEVRGALGEYYEIFSVLGVVIVYALATFLSLFYLSLVCAIIPIIYGAIFIFMPESPLYYISMNQEDKAVKSLKFLRGKEFDIRPELDDIRSIVSHSAATQGTIWQNLSASSVRKALTMSVLLMLFQQFSGIPAVNFNASAIFKASNVDMHENVAALIIGAVQWTGAFSSSLLVDRWGRRPLLFSSAAVTMSGMAALGTYFYLQDAGEDVSGITWLPLVSLSVSFLIFEMGLGAIPWMVIGELFPPHVQSSAAGVSGFTNWFLAFVVSKFYPNLVVAIGIGPTFWIFAIIMAVCVISVYTLMIETKGKSVPEIQAALEEGTNFMRWMKSRFRMREHSSEQTT